MNMDTLWRPKRRRRLVSLFSGFFDFSKIQKNNGAVAEMTTGPTRGPILKAHFQIYGPTTTD